MGKILLHITSKEVKITETLLLFLVYIQWIEEGERKCLLNFTTIENWHDFVWQGWSCGVPEANWQNWNEIMHQRGYFALFNWNFKVKLTLKNERFLKSFTKFQVNFKHFVAWKCQKITNKYRDHNKIFLLPGIWRIKKWEMFFFQFKFIYFLLLWDQKRNVSKKCFPFSRKNIENEKQNKKKEII